MQREESLAISLCTIILNNSRVLGLLLTSAGRFFYRMVQSWWTVSFFWPHVQDQLSGWKTRWQLIFIYWQSQLFLMIWFIRELIAPYTRERPTASQIPFHTVSLRNLLYPTRPTWSVCCWKKLSCDQTTWVHIVRIRKEMSKHHIYVFEDWERFFYQEASEIRHASLKMIILKNGSI